MMKETTTVELDLAGQAFRLETGLLAQQANGAVTAYLGDNVLFSTACATKEPREGIDFFPLQIEYREKFYAAGRFPGGYFKREARPSEKEILISRVTDRPIRTLFPEHYRNDVQIINTLFATDGKRDVEVMSINAASAALMISEIPFMGPIGAVKVGRVDGQFIANPTHEEIETGDLNLIYCGTREKMMMIEGDAKEIAEADLVAAMKFAHELVIQICDAQLKLRADLGMPEKVVDIPEQDLSLLDRARELKGAEFSDILTIAGKIERQDRVTALKAELKEALLAEKPEMTGEEYFQMFDKLEIETVRRNAMEKGVRVDGRSFDELRGLSAQVGIIPRIHGTSVFNRGETQALATVTLGTVGDAQSLDGITGGTTTKKFLLHYNFPPYSVGEVGRIGFTGRREIGHGNLAERALKHILPDDYPYTVRIVSEIMGSNGSSSMASACAGTLALMDAGVPIKKPVAGISVGLYTAADQYKLAMDILGVEDHCGDMDFKVCGTRDGITAFQVDLKIDGLNWEQIEGSFAMARQGRLDILDFMATVLEAPRAELSEWAPQMGQTKIPPDKIGLLIGPGGKNIKRIQETYGVKVDIEEDGSVSVSGDGDADIKGAVFEISSMTAEAEVGKVYEGVVRGVKDFGAFVEILPGKEGLVHISEMANHRVGSVDDICKMGDRMKVKCLNVDENGKIRLSRKAAMNDENEAETAPEA